MPDPQGTISSSHLYPQKPTGLIRGEPPFIHDIHYYLVKLASNDRKVLNEITVDSGVKIILVYLMKP